MPLDGTSMRTRVARVSSGALAKGCGARISRPASVLATSTRTGQSAPSPCRSTRPFSVQSVPPAIFTPDGSPMNAGNGAPVARPRPLKSIAAVTSPASVPGAIATSNGPPRIVPRSDGAVISRLCSSKRPATFCAGARSAGSVTLTPLRLATTR